MPPSMRSTASTFARWPKSCPVCRPSSPISRTPPREGVKPPNDRHDRNGQPGPCPVQVVLRGGQGRGRARRVLQLVSRRVGYYQPDPARHLAGHDPRCIPGPRQRQYLPQPMRQAGVAGAVRRHTRPGWRRHRRAPRSGPSASPAWNPSTTRYACAATGSPPSPVPTPHPPCNTGRQHVPGRIARGAGRWLPWRRCAVAADAARHVTADPPAAGHRGRAAHRKPAGPAPALPSARRLPRPADDAATINPAISSIGA